MVSVADGRRVHDVGPAASVDSEGVTVFVRGGDNALWFGRIDNNGAWTGWRTGSGSITSDPVTVTSAAGAEVFVRGGDNAIYQARVTTSGSWSGWRRIAGNITSNMARPPTATGCNSSCAAATTGCTRDA